MSERHFRRLRDVYEESGPEGLIDRRRGRANGRRAPVDEIEWVLGSFRTRYFDFRIKHFHEVILGQAMADGAPFKRSYSWTKSVLQSRGLEGQGQGARQASAPAPSQAVARDDAAVALRRAQEAPATFGLQAAPSSI